MAPLLLASRLGSTRTRPNADIDPVGAAESAGRNRATDLRWQRDGALEAEGETEKMYGTPMTAVWTVAGDPDIVRSNTDARRAIDKSRSSSGSSLGKRSMAHTSGCRGRDVRRCEQVQPPERTIGSALFAR